MRLAEGDRVVAIAAFRAGLADRAGMGDDDGPATGTAAAPDRLDPARENGVTGT